MLYIPYIRTDFLNFSSRVMPLRASLPWRATEIIDNLEHLLKRDSDDL